MLKVIVVEDEELVRRGIVLAVDWASVNCAVVGEAANGEQALGIIKEYNPDIIVTDLKMPKMDGIAMIEKLREQGSKADVIILTAYSDFSYAQSAIKLGAVDYLLKPFRDGELEQAINKINRRAREKAESPRAKAFSEDIQDNLKGKSKYVMEALRYISEHYNDPDISVSTIAGSLELSESHLSHIFKKETSYTVSNYLTNYRIHKAINLLRDCRAKVYEVAEKVGYRDVTYFSSIFKKSVGISPSDFQKQSQ